jgi:hypothetical protein
MGVVSKGSKRAARGERKLVAVPEPSSDATTWLSASDAPQGMLLALPTHEDSERVVVEWRGRSWNVHRDPTLASSVLASAIARRERVVVDVDADRASVVGALRTRPTAGLEPVDRFEVDAQAIELRATKVLVEGEEVELSSRTAKSILRAASEIESFAERIVSRASGVQKIIGRMLRLN